MTFPRQRQQSKSVAQSKAMQRALFACTRKKLDGQTTQKPYIASFRELVSKCLMQWTWRPYIPSPRDLVSKCLTQWRVHTDPFPLTTLRQGLAYSGLKHRTRVNGQRVDLFISKDLTPELSDSGLLGDLGCLWKTNPCWRSPALFN